MRTRDWADVLAGARAERRDRRAGWSGSSRACEAPRSRSAGCSSAGREARPTPARPGGGRRRSAALPTAPRRRSTGLDRPLSRYLLELEPEIAEGRSWYGGPGAGELREWDEVLDRAGVRVSAARVAQAYLELAVLVRALEGLADAARIGSRTDSSSLWAGLFDLRENLLGPAVDDLRALAA